MGTMGSSTSDSTTLSLSKSVLITIHSSHSCDPPSGYSFYGAFLTDIYHTVYSSRLHAYPLLPVHKHSMNQGLFVFKSKVLVIIYIM